MNGLFKENSFDSIYHLAGRAGVRYSMDHPEIYLSTNTLGTLNILNCMNEFGVDKILLASTSSLYAGLPMPFHEELPVNTPISPYAASKKAAEMMAYTYHYLYKMNVVIARYFTVYGPMGRPDMSVLRFIKWIDCNETIELFGDGKQTRDFSYVEDVAEGSIVASEKTSGFEIFNVGGGNQPTSMLEIISILETLLKKKAKIKYLPQHIADVSDTQADVSKAIRLLSWRPSVQIEQGLKQTVDWYMNNKEICKFI